jgi:murein hydrolase activator
MKVSTPIMISQLFSMPHLIRCIVFTLFMGLSFQVQAQELSAKQRQLEAQKKALLTEIGKINSLLFRDQKKEKNILTEVEDVNYKVNVIRNLIKVTNQQVNILTRQINQNQNEISELRAELTLLRERYADMVVKSYKSKNQHSKLLFLLSSDDFKQAYKRLQYIKQYADYQKEQSDLIKEKTNQLQETNKRLLSQKSDKEQLLKDNKAVQRDLEQQLKRQQTLMASIQKSMGKYRSQISAKQREADKIDREIDRLIREAIAASNKKAGKSSKSKEFALTPAAKALAVNFESNKGKLPWPVDRGIVKVKYGKQPSPIDRTLIINSVGVRIATQKDAPVKAVFDGEVSKVMVFKNANPVILIRHGNYITAYKNLSKIKVKVGDKVRTGQVIGEVFTNSSNETMLGFAIYQNQSPQNPAHWIYRM